MSPVARNIVDRLDATRQQWWLFTLLTTAVLAGSISFAVMLAFMLGDAFVQFSQMTLAVLLLIWLSVSVWLSTPRLLSAEEPDQNKTPILSRLQVELFLGRASLNPTDLNRIIDYDNSIQNFT